MHFDSLILLHLESALWQQLKPCISPTQEPLWHARTFLEYALLRSLRPDWSPPALEFSHHHHWCVEFLNTFHVYFLWMIYNLLLREFQENLLTHLTSMEDILIQIELLLLGLCMTMIQRNISISSTAQLACPLR